MHLMEASQNVLTCIWNREDSPTNTVCARQVVLIAGVLSDTVLELMADQIGEEGIHLLMLASAWSRSVRVTHATAQDSVPKLAGC